MALNSIACPGEKILNNRDVVCTFNKIYQVLQLYACQFSWEMQVFLKASLDLLVHFYSPWILKHCDSFKHGNVLEETEQNRK